jgi:hypothetical protein
MALGGKACRDWLKASRSAASRARVTASRAVLRGEPADTAGVSAAQRHSAAPAPWQDNPRFHDMIVGAIVGACPMPVSSRRPGRPFTAPQDILAETGTGPHAWTVFYTAADLIPARRVAFRPLAGLTAQPASRCPGRPPQPCGACSEPAYRPTQSKPSASMTLLMPPTRRNTCPRHLQPDDVRPAQSAGGAGDQGNRSADPHGSAST